MDKKLQGQVGIVTGASSGIGAACAEALAMAGASVVINYPAESAKQGAGAVLDKIVAQGGNGIIYQCDVSKEDQVQQMFGDVAAKYGMLDILINNAGLQRDSPFQDMTLEQWNYVLGVNLTGQFLCAREAVRIFLKQGVVQGRSRAAGKIICMSSVHEVIPWGGHANYATSKGGIMMLMKSIAQEFAPSRIRVNSIGPGAIKTPINHTAWETPAAEQRLLELIPYNRIGLPEDIGAVAVWLASDDSDYITGQTIFADGGMTLYPGFSTNG